MTTATKSPIAGYMALQPIFSMAENLARNRKKDRRNNPPFRIKLMAELHDASRATDK